MRLLTRQGYLIEEQGMTYLAEADTDRALAPLQAASCTYRIALGPRAGQKVLSLQSLPSQARPSSQELRVKAHGFSLHAAVRWRADQRRELEHLCRYITRPAIANERLKRNRADQVVLQLKSPYKDGTTHIVMEPLEFMERLAALVPRPRLHLIRFHGVLAPNAQHCHLMTLSARYTTDCGIVRPICLAVLRLITNSNFVGCSTGRSAGLASFSILSTNAAARRNNSSSFAACCASFAYSF